MTSPWTQTSSATGSWYSLPPTGYQLLTEDGFILTTEDDAALLAEYTAAGWSDQSNSATTWTVS